MRTGNILQYSHTVGFYAMSGKGFYNPVDVAIRDDGLMYVLNRAGPEVAGRLPYKRISMCTLDEEFLGDFGSGGSGDGQLMWPASITLDTHSNVYVSDEALHRISVFDRDGIFQGKWGSYGINEGQFDKPAGMTMDQEGNLLIVDGGNCRVQRYTKEGRFLDQWGTYGNEPGQFNYPWGITTDLDWNIYVADWRNDRIQKFTSAGDYVSSFGSSGSGNGQLNRPAGVAVDDTGSIYIADWGNERLQILDHKGDFQAALRGESGISKWGQDYFLSNMDELEERHKADLEPHIESSEPDYLRYQSGSVEKLFWGPTSIVIDHNNNIYVVDSCRFRIQVFQRNV